MKKLFTLMAAALTAAASAWAAVPELLFKGQPVSPDVTYESGYTVETTVIPGVMTIYSYLQDTEMSLRGQVGQKVTVKVISSKEVAFCGMDGRCENGTEIDKTVTLAQDTVPLELHVETQDWFGTSPAELLSDVEVTVKAWYNATPGEVATAKVLLTTTPASASIAGVNADLTNVSLVGNVLNYSVAQPSKLEIYGITGALVISQKVAAEGSVSLDSLHPGVYIYSLGQKSGKILVRK